MEEYHLNLTKWEETRENERRRLLTEEAEDKQKGGVFSSVNKHRSRFVERWMSRTKPENVEPGVGKWVSYLNRERKLDSLIGRRPTAPPAPKGLYLYGNVGSGIATEGIVKHRRRFHFHEAMLQIHEHMHKIWKNQVEEKSLQSGISSWIMNLPFDTKVKEWIDAEERYNQEVYMKNILPAVADKFLVDWQANQRGASILCFDEIQTVDVFAIVALSGIVSRLLSTGTVLVATSNRAPRELNQDGMQWEIFLKFLAKLEDHCETVPVGSEIDYRRIIAQTSIDKIQYFWPLDSIKINEFENVWNEVARHSEGRITSDTIAVMFGRTLEVPQCCNGVARFTFEYLCGRPVGAADYIAIAKNFHTVFISDIPMMSMRIRDKVLFFFQNWEGKPTKVGDIKWAKSPNPKESEINPKGPISFQEPKTTLALTAAVPQPAAFQPPPESPQRLRESPDTDNAEYTASNTHRLSPPMRSPNPPQEQLGRSSPHAAASLPPFGSIEHQQNCSTPIFDHTKWQPQNFPLAVKPETEFDLAIYYEASPLIAFSCLLNQIVKARRFITLVDELYNYHCSLFCTAAASIDDLFQGTEEGKLFDLERQVYFFGSLAAPVTSLCC
ncbi:hypothetical protein RHMOL_Rhmol07G0200700 [Rhododendron molle]|uniref:Uncharacterized protein n=1 Tax=Rhododendron molle TaxID=49168 RepID=A0ACC0N3C7_RHOML|nr:hypothetical protein RHMOL_Rhmol07G0200700 [Rhododendron molle]